MNPSINSNSKLNHIETRLPDSRNSDVLVWVGDRLFPRELAKVRDMVRVRVRNSQFDLNTIPCPNPNHNPYSNACPNPYPSPNPNPYPNPYPYPNPNPKVSVFDSSVQGGDAVWEGLRVYDSKIFKFEDHLQRLIDSAKVYLTLSSTLTLTLTTINLNCYY
jgi:hypothetical protein